MPRLPDLNDLGSRPVPQSRRSIATNPRAGIVGDAVAGLGQTVGRIGEQMVEKEDRFAFEAANGRLQVEDIAARQELEKDPDYASALPRYQERMKGAQAAAAKLIRSNSDRRLFEVSAKGAVARGSAAIATMARGKETTANIALLYDDLDNRRIVGMSAMDEPTKIAAIDGAASMIQGAVEKGYLDPVQARQVQKNWTSDYNVEQVNGFLAREDAIGAKAYFDKTRGMIDPGAAVSLEGRLKGALDFRQSIDDVERANALPTIGAPAEATRPGKRQPVADGGAVISALFPKANITSTYRAGDHPLSKANPSSWHTKSHAAVDVAPIPGLTFERYVKQISDAGYQVIEAKNEVGAGRSAHATGDHWHVVIGNGGTPQQGARRWDKEAALANIDKLADAEGWSPERRERAKSQQNGVITRDEDLQRREDEAESEKAWDVAAALGDNFRDVSQIPNFSTLDAKEQLTLRGRAEANRAPKSVPANGDTAVSLERASIAAPEAFIGEDLRKYQHQMTPSEYASLLITQEKMKAEGADGITANTREDISGAINFYATEDMGLDKPTTASREKFMRVFGAMQSDINSITRGKRKPTDEELEGAFGRAAMKVFVRGRGITGFFGGGEVDYRFNATPDEKYEVRVPDAVRARIVASYRSVWNRDPPEGAVGDIYAQHKGKKGFWQ